MNQYEFSDEPLEPMDYLKALRVNHLETQHLKDQKIDLMEKAVKAGYRNVDIAKALNQTDAAIRLYRVRHNISATKASS